MKKQKALHGKYNLRLWKKLFKGKTVIYSLGNFFSKHGLLSLPPKTLTLINLAEQYWEFNDYFQSPHSWIFLLLPLERLSNKSKKCLKEKSQSQKWNGEAWEWIEEEKNACRSNPQRNRRTEVVGERDLTGEEQNMLRPASKNSSWLGTVGKV